MREVGSNEWVWKYLRAQVTHNVLFPSIAGLIEAVVRLFADLVAQPQTVLSIIGNSGRPSKRNPQLLCSPI